MGDTLLSSTRGMLVTDDPPKDTAEAQVLEIFF